MTRLVVDASAIVEVLLDTPHAQAVSGTLRGADIVHAPAHVDSEVLSALGRIHRAGGVAADAVRRLVAGFAEASIQRHPLAPLLRGAWELRGNMRLNDALYVELCHQLGCTLVTVDRRLAATAGVPVIVPS
jgi:predicted nucleic acid-binding protein